MTPFLPQKLPLQEVAWERLIPHIGRANRSLAHYDGVLYGVPNPEILLAPLTTQEAVSSSKIGGTQATLGEGAEIRGRRNESLRRDIQEIINYRKALRAAETELKTRPFNLNVLMFGWRGHRRGYGAGLVPDNAAVHQQQRLGGRDATKRFGRRDGYKSHVEIWISFERAPARGEFAW